MSDVGLDSELQAELNSGHHVYSVLERIVMSGVWEPAQSFQVTDEMLAGYLELIANLDLENLSNGFPQDEMKSGAKLMKLQAKDWEAANALSDEQLTDLVRFFTKAEMQFTGWDAGKTSPVIYLVKMLKQRKAFSTELKQWVKANTDNRFLPNGAVVL